MKKIKIDRDTIDVLDILLNSKDYLNLNEIINILKKNKTFTRKLQRILKDLVDNKRAIQEGAASSTKYRVENVERLYRRLDFIYVHKGSNVAGIIFKLDEVFEFYYLNQYIVDLLPNIASLDILIEPYEFKELPAVFEENIPEGINREILEVNSQTADEFTILTTLKDNIGDLYFSKTLDDISYKESSKAPSYLNILDDMLGSNARINILEDFTIDIDEINLFPEGHDLTKLSLNQTDGISGFQYKKLVNIDFDSKVIYSKKDESHNYILKPYSKLKSNKDLETYFPHISLNEHLFMSFAKNELGFRVPYTAIVKTDDQEFHYLIKRFDRHKVHRYAKTTFAVYMGLRSEKKYDTTSEKLFRRIAKELISPTQRMELLKHYAYSVIIQHEDMHTKNLSLIFDKNKVLFSPLYDVACTGFYSTTKKYDSHLKINGKQKNIRPNDFKGLCEILNIKHLDFKKVANDIALKYENILPEYIKEIRKLGHIPFYKMKLVQKAGGIPQWKAAKEPIEFADVLEKFHNKRVEELKHLCWM
ncbi:MAG: type II toxin-antitoxin system HipA family toxin [Campylobacterota bacterium]|nr:type II toxin-antitoxin system HipA family toxin [Campylobacterota bacterium]